MGNLTYPSLSVGKELQEIYPISNIYVFHIRRSLLFIPIARNDNATVGVKSIS